jgi:hypothetical protein
MWRKKLAFTPATQGVLAAIAARHIYCPTF